MDYQKANQVILWKSDCTKLDTVKVTFRNGEAKLIAEGATSGAMYYLSVKIDPTSLKGTSVSVPYPTVRYTFATWLDGVELITSVDMWMQYRSNKIENI